MIQHLEVASFQQNPRISFVFNTICDWYGWSWSYGPDEEKKANLHFSYGVEKAQPQSFHLANPFLIMDIERKICGPDWDQFDEVPNPCKHDPVAGVFYLLTCAEEYLATSFDDHGRVQAKELSVIKNGYGSTPLADRLAEVLAKAIWKSNEKEGLPEMLAEQGYSSIDVDQIFAVRFKPYYKRLGNLGRHLLNRSWKEALTIAGTLLGGKDPFDQFDWIRSIHEKRGLKPIVFMLMGYENATDPAWLPDHPQWPSFIEQLLPWTKLGVHPSYRTASNALLLKEEKMRLENLVGAPVTRSRQHFLRLSWPETFESLVQLGISEDYTLGWPDWLGFRMGTARSCFWYNLKTDEQTTLRLYPPALMEVTARYYMRLSPKQLMEKAAELANEAKRSNSGLRVIWHNSNLSAISRWEDWKSIYPDVLDLIAE